MIVMLFRFLFFEFSNSLHLNLKLSLQRSWKNVSDLVTGMYESDMALN
jgi:hypothetical protein